MKQDCDTRDNDRREKQRGTRDEIVRGVVANL